MSKSSNVYFCISDSILQYASKWNTNARHCLVAQSVLSVILRWQTPEKIMELEDVKTLLEGLIPYTERHYQRMARLQQVREEFYCWRGEGNVWLTPTISRWM